jgi:hypothetical protein
MKEWALYTGARMRARAIGGGRSSSGLGLGLLSVLKAAVLGALAVFYFLRGVRGSRL